MFGKILKKDLKRKKTMNILLLLFIILTSSLLGTSINMLSTNSTIVEGFLDKAKIADFSTMTYYSKENEDIAKKWLSESKSVKDYSIETFLLLMKKDVILPEGKKALDFDNAMGLQTSPKKYTLLFDEKDDPLVVKQGEIAIPFCFANMTELQVGDRVTINLEGKSREFTICHLIKDAYCGSPMMGYKRWIINEEDYNYLDSDKASKFNMLNVNGAEGVEEHALAKEFNLCGLASLSAIEKNLVRMTYLISTIIAAIIMVISCLLIFISLLMLRFTIQFTIQEDYKEIGIMKAIGLKGRSIQGIYMVKYLAMGVLGGLIGYVISIFLGSTFMKAICSEMVMEETGWFNLSGLIGTTVAILLILLFCRLCTRKLNRVSAIDAIRGGSTGERYHKVRGFRLNKWKAGANTFIACNDLLHSMRRYVVLFITFIIGTIVLIIPLNVVNTMRSPAILRLFGFADFDFSVVPNDANTIVFKYSREQLLSYVDELEKMYNDNGIPVELYPEINYMCRLYKDDATDSKSIYTAKSYNREATDYRMIEGSCPILDNEVAITTNIAEYYNLAIGDRMHIQVGKENGEYIVTGIYSSMINMGENIRLSPTASYPLEGCSGLSIMGLYEGNEKEADYISHMKELRKDCQIETTQVYLQGLMGNVVDTLSTVNTGILIIVLCIIFLISLLVGKLILTKETAEIAILKSLGYKNRHLRMLQIKRMAILLLVAVFFGTILGNLLTEPVAMIIFNIMGATSLELWVDPLQIYLIYPGIVLICTMFAALISTSDISKIKVWELNNQE